MFEIGDFVIKANNGICRVDDIGHLDISTVNKERLYKIPKIAEAWITDDNQREQKYKEAIQSCDPEKLMSIIKNMYARMQKRTAQGKKSTSVDEHFFKIAENNLYTELAFAIGKNKEDMQHIITEKIAEKV